MDHTAYQNQFDLAVYSHILASHNPCVLRNIVETLKNHIFVLVMERDKGCSASRTVDQAMRRLRKSGFVEYFGYRGWMVVKDFPNNDLSRKEDK